jgi:hypothetical protein
MIIYLKKIIRKLRVLLIYLRVKKTKKSQDFRYDFYIKNTEYLKIQADPYNQTYNPISPTGDLSLAVNYLIWQNDYKLKLNFFNFGKSEKVNSPLYSLVERGFTKIKNEHFKILNNKNFYEKIKKVFDIQKDNEYRNSGAQLQLKQEIYIVNDPTYHLPELSELYEIEELNLLCKKYIGDDCKLQNAELMMVDKISNSSQGSGLFHHDTIGHRLKIYFNFDIEKNDRPTYYAEKSHFYTWPENHSKVSRFNEEFVKKNFNIVPLKKDTDDEIIIFDSNGLHRGHYEKSNSSRYSLVLEYASKKKFEDLKPLGNFPMGSKPQRISKKVNISKTLLDKDYIKNSNNANDYVEYGEQWWTEFQPLFFYG